MKNRERMRVVNKFWSTRWKKVSAALKTKITEGNRKCLDVRKNMNNFVVIRQVTLSVERNFKWSKNCVVIIYQMSVIQSIVHRKKKKKTSIYTWDRTARLEASPARSLGDRLLLQRRISGLSAYSVFLPNSVSGNSGSYMAGNVSLQL
jgi:hypothetical protein